MTSWHNVGAMINERIRALVRARGWKIVELAKRINQLDPARKVHPSQLSRMLKGNRKWVMSHLELVAKALGVQVGDLADEHVAIPIVSEISSVQECGYPGAVEETIIGYVPLPRIIAEKKDWPKAEEVYGIRIKDKSFEPVLLEGAELIVHRNGKIKEGDLVVYCDATNRMFLGRLYFHNDQLLLRSLSPSNQKDMILPRRHLSSMDRVVAQIFN
ncbi:MAG: hypothetical protein FJ135_16715 [Deltaproteobacteria bacterium]|nr:hypothetical protein [Deltaproteobacteria bacterium]